MSMYSAPPMRDVPLACEARLPLRCARDSARHFALVGTLEHGAHELDVLCLDTWRHRLLDSADDVIGGEVAQLEREKRAASCSISRPNLAREFDDLLVHGDERATPLMERLPRSAERRRRGRRCGRGATALRSLMGALPSFGVKKRGPGAPRAFGGRTTRNCEQ